MANLNVADVTAANLTGQYPGLGTVLLNLYTAANANGGTAESVSAAGAVGLDSYRTELTISGTVAYTLANGTFVGQRKEIECVAASASPRGTLTITTPFTAEGATHVFFAVGQKINLVWTALGWHMTGKTRAGVLVPVIGTTVLQGATANSGDTLALNYSVSVTGTVSSTGTKSLPSGTVPGERCYVGNSVAGGTPIGNINFVGVTLANVAAADLQAIGALTDTVTLEWTGAAWLVVANSGITVA